MSETKLKPWCIRENIHAHGTAYVVDENAKELAFCQTVSDAERIVEAHNSQLEMYEALKNALAICKFLDVDQKYGEVIHPMYAALAKAEGRS